MLIEGVNFVCAISHTKFGNLLNVYRSLSIDLP